MRLRREPGVISEARRRVRGIGARLAQRLAIVERVAAGEFLRVRVDQVGELEELRRALRGACPWPRTIVEGLASLGDRGLRVGGAGFRSDADDGIVRGI